MAGKNDFYRGRRKRANVVLILLAILVCVIALLIVLFYGMQKYAVITKDSVTIDITGKTKTSTMRDQSQSIERTFDAVEANVVFKEPDFSAIASTAGKKLKQMRAVFIAADDITKEKVEASVSRLSTGNSIMIEMKPRSGSLMWHSNSDVAINYAINYDTPTTASIQSYVNYIKEHDVWLVAQISCCVDFKLVSNSTGLSLKTVTGGNYVDETGYWLDPYNTTVRNYITDLITELYDMGFDEVVLADVAHPTLPDNTEIYYSMDMSVSPDPEKAVLGFATTIAERFADRKGVLSIYADSAYALVKTDKATGQNVPVFLKVFDRIYYNTDKYTYKFNLQDLTRSITEYDAKKRFVPVVVNYLPNDPATMSWVLIDAEE